MKLLFKFCSCDLFPKVFIYEMFISLTINFCFFSGDEVSVTGSWATALISKFIHNKKDKVRINHH